MAANVPTPAMIARPKPGSPAALEAAGKVVLRIVGAGEFEVCRATPAEVASLVLAQDHHHKWWDRYGRDQYFHGRDPSGDPAPERCELCGQVATDHNFYAALDRNGFSQTCFPEEAVAIFHWGSLGAHSTAYVPPCDHWRCEAEG